MRAGYGLAFGKRRTMPVAKRDGPRIYQVWWIADQEWHDHTDPKLLGEYDDPLTAAPRARDEHGLGGDELLEVIVKGDPIPVSVGTRRNRFGSGNRAKGKPWATLNHQDKVARVAINLKCGVGIKEQARRLQLDVEEIRRLAQEAADRLFA